MTSIPSEKLCVAESQYICIQLLCKIALCETVVGQNVQIKNHFNFNLLHTTNQYQASMINKKPRIYYTEVFGRDLDYS
jgi:hypothetical protein